MGMMTQNTPLFFFFFHPVERSGDAVTVGWLVKMSSIFPLKIRSEIHLFFLFLFMMLSNSACRRAGGGWGKGGSSLDQSVAGSPHPLARSFRDKRTVGS